MSLFSKYLPGRLTATLLLFLLTLLSANADARIRQLRYAGATTLQLHFMPQASKLFKNRTGIEFSITGGNTGPGIQALIAETSDIAGAGRFLTPHEKSAGLTEHLIGWDALYVIVHQDNPVETLSMEQLRDVLSGKVRNWAKVGGTDLPIMVVSSPPGSGMRSSVRKKILKTIPFSDQEVISPIIRDADRLAAQFPTAICVLSASMVDMTGIKVLRVDNVAPDQQTIIGGSYQLIKPLLLITKNAPTQEVHDFVNLVKSTEGQRIIADKFFPLKPKTDTNKKKRTN